MTRQVKTLKSKLVGKKCFNCQKVGHLANGVNPNSKRDGLMAKAMIQRM